MHAQKTETRYNIVHILADDIGWDDAAFPGNRLIPTPNLDRLEKESVRLENFYAPHSTCTPTRAALLTGRYAFRANGGTGLDILWPKSPQGLDPAQQSSLPAILKRVGYETALVGKWHLGNRRPFLPNDHGFDLFYGIRHPNDHGPERHGMTGDQDLDSILLWRNEFPVRPLSNADIAELPRQFVIEVCRFLRRKGTEKKPFYIQYSNIETHTPWFVPLGFEGESGKGTYADALAFLDHSVGVIIQTLQDAGLLDNTLIVFSSDNGPLVERYPELEACYGKFARVDTSRKRHLRDGKYQGRYEGGCRVPCLIRLPGSLRKPSPLTLNGMADGTDLFATMLHLAGTSLPKDYPIDGRNMLPWLQGLTADTGTRKNFIGYNMGNKPGSYREGNWVLVLPTGNRKDHELYNLAADPGQKKNLANDEPVQLQNMMKKAESEIQRRKEKTN